jgi:hypothetical protein
VGGGEGISGRNVLKSIIWTLKETLEYWNWWRGRSQILVTLKSQSELSKIGTGEVAK